MKTSFTILLSSLIATQLFAAELPCLTVYHSDSAFMAAALHHESVAQLDGLNSVSIARKTDEAKIEMTLRNGKSFQLNVHQQCATGILEASLVQNFICKKTIDCMPSNDLDQHKYCGEEYLAWAQKNCGFQPEIIF